MNPIISYKDLKTPFGTDISLVRKRMLKNTTRNFLDKQEFIDHIDSIKPSRRVDFYLVIECSCGKVYKFEDNIAVPSLNLICGCSRKLIIYEN